MKKNNVAVSIFSNWTNLVLSIAMAFVVSPILVNKLGDESYGIWVLIVSVTGYFTVLDFGVNTAIVRFISKYTAVKDYKKAIEVYSSSFALFFFIGLFVIAVTAIIAFFFKDIFSIETFSNHYIYLVFFIVGLDLALNLTFSVLMGTLRGLQRFFEINVISITLAIIKNIILVYLLYTGHSILALAVLQICMTITKFILQFTLLKKDYAFLTFKRQGVNKETFKLLYNYSIYSFLIAVAIKVIFFTDSVVIGAFVNVSQVTYYAIPAMLVEYLEKFIWAIIAVLIPIISSRDAVGNTDANKSLYLTGTKYSLLLISPVVFVLYLVGDNFITIWMGSRYGEPSGQVLQILLVGHVFFLSQLIAQGILKGISKHKVLALILCAEAICNLVLSILLAPKYGIIGVAIGTAVPLTIINLILIPLYTCKTLGINYFDYLFKSVLHPVVALVVPLVIAKRYEIELSSYLEVILFSLAVLCCYAVYILFFQLQKEHKEKVFGVFSKLIKSKI